MDMAKPELVKAYLLELQSRIIDALQEVDSQASNRRDEWVRPEGGGGLSRLLEGGAVIEKGGVNFSDVQGENLPKTATAARPHLEGASFRAMGVSLVLHPLNPFVPTTHMNVRFFLANKGDVQTWWFGGGFDLTPYYGFEEDAVYGTVLPRMPASLLVQSCIHALRIGAMSISLFDIGQSLAGLVACSSMTFSWRVRLSEHLNFCRVWETVS